jgi:hypothetical protein
VQGKHFQLFGRTIRAQFSCLISRLEKYRAHSNMLSHVLFNHLCTLSVVFKIDKTYSMTSKSLLFHLSMLQTLIIPMAAIEVSLEFILQVLTCSSIVVENCHRSKT